MERTELSEDYSFKEKDRNRKRKRERKTKNYISSDIALNKLNFYLLFVWMSA